MKLFDPQSPVSLGPLAQALADKVAAKKAVIGIVGLGYVGLPIGLEFAKRDFNVMGFDVSAQKVDMLNAGENYNEDLSDAEIAAVAKNGRLKATTDFSRLSEVDVVFIAVPTPFNANKDPDLSFIERASEKVGEALQRGQLVILKSTTFPGTTEDYMVPILERSGLTTSVDFFAAFSPERVDPGNKTFHTGNTPIVVGGIGAEATYLASMVNNAIIEKVYMVTNPKIAELEKLLENIFRSVNIALVNELALLCERMEGIDVWEVIEAAATKPFGYMKFLPGPGIGGHCIPIDPYYLSWLARAYDFETRFITLSANTNESMPLHVTNKVIHIIAKQPISLSQARVLVVGATFKKNVKDMRHSPAEPIIRNLEEAGVGHIDVADMWVPEYEAHGRVFKCLEVTPEMLKTYHCAIVVTDHDAFDPQMIVDHSNFVVDTRNMMKNVTGSREKITLLGSTL